ncbi:MAG: hypothetical protein LBK00_01745 [Treponema sp.]|jgi:hypothetical protein|nr:hypothetical protein [Treponema sp.]
MKHILFSLFVVAFFASCSAQINGSLNIDASADVTLYAALEPRMATLIRTLSRVGGGTGAQIIDGQAIGRSMAVAPGIKAASFANVNSSTIEGAISLYRVDEFLALPSRAVATRFITYEQNGEGGQITIHLDRSSGPQIIPLISRDVVDYLTALMAPVVTGETLSRADYLNLVTMVYGKPVADEMAAARIRASIAFPGPITAINGGVATDDRAEFDIPLLDLLVLEHALAYQVSW